MRFHARVTREIMLAHAHAYTFVCLFHSLPIRFSEGKLHDYNVPILIKYHSLLILRTVISFSRSSRFYIFVTDEER